MLLVTVNKPKNLLYVSFVGTITADDLARGREDLLLLLGDLPDGFRMLTDLSHLDSMDFRSAAELGRMMELFDERGVSAVVRVIPDPSKDIGMDILTIFHYPHHPSIFTCKTMTEAVGCLGL